MFTKFLSKFFNSNDLAQGHLMSLTCSIHKWWTWLYFIPYSTVTTEKWKITAFPISRSTQGHDWYKFCSTTDSDDTYQVSRQLAQWFWRRFVKVLSIFEHLGHVTWTINTNFLPPPSLCGSTWNFALICQAVFRDKMTMPDARAWVYYMLTMWACGLRWAQPDYHWSCTIDPVNSHLISGPRISIWCLAKDKGTSYFCIYLFSLVYQLISR